MPPAENGSTVRVYYEARLEDGTIFDSSAVRGPLELTLGEAGVDPCLGEFVIGMVPGELKTARLKAEKAYECFLRDLTMDLYPGQFMPNALPRYGQELFLGQPDGRAVPARIGAVSQESVRLIPAHPLAGRDLIFDIRLLEIVSQV